MTRTLQPLPGSTILFEGDSLTAFRVPPCLDTWAWQRLSASHYGYPEKVGDWVFCQRPDLNLSCRIGAVGGSIMADVAQRCATVTEVVKPGIVVMTIGSNDAARAIPLPEFRKQVESYARRLHECCGGRILYLGNIVACPGATEGSGEKRAAAKPYYDAVSEVVTAHQGLAVDLGAVLLAKSTVLVRQYSGHTIYHDGGHFNAVGNEIIAGVVLRALGLMQTPGDPACPV